ncbi:Coenzyme F420 hydrogenase/dehydrogenase, beta subunit C-terminal domain [uncultured Methanobrevibacter sp.]|uniref:Coenzyme F420 hydrogenase/dehydrogenase, beta subunit C-terminal domain n=1 Tax=uncultured Methanobrevibacter sp. TaxID=253161 RepID=UPI0025F92D0D|nr:Coenzyme F420 hydrogenase/dehydrogenase, beta subunit C-terminal domain [uncultured Methanobrevibacter sp.]
MDQIKTAMVGTPCQIMAATKINKYSDITGGSPIDIKIGLFCMENFSYTYLEKFLKQNNIEMYEIKEFRIDKGKFLVNLIDGNQFSIPISETNIFTRKNCHICTDYTSDLSDISVGSVGSKDGYSTVIVRTKKGQKIINELKEKDLIICEDLSDKGINLLKTIANNKITKNQKNIQSRERVARQVLSQRHVTEETLHTQSCNCQFSNLEADVISVGGCVLCGACEYVCKSNIIQINDRKPQAYGECDDDCHACYYACPRTYVSTEILPEDIDSKPFGEYIEIMEVKSNSINGQDGGVVSGILMYLLEKNIVDEVFLVGQDENVPWKPKSFVSNKVWDVIAAAGTKYSTVPIGFKALSNKSK